jgi:hypothetical protein
MAKFVQLTLDWTQAAKLPPVSQRSVEATEPEEATLPGVEVSTTAAPKATKVRHPACLPVPKPLVSAIGKGNFGEDERGPIRPTAAEVRAITEHHAEKLIDLLERLRVADAQLHRSGQGDRSSLIRQKDQLLSAYQSGLALYSEDFGQHAANRLDAYVRHQVEKE